ncbi:putative Isoprenylcysteine carboxyl methyltransferase [Pseudodesulfovibrio piezophilus C1TLV30]|uniref:Putative Isoprenylcysteine carboxyl methyltransferase n=2 Tax=Pseudodesulfovibrio TaxID=2035811 RepID=M1WVN2_PSEP2|nr:putative Isoprenylcysteine carboxyl methyltransferase [Pseudodesulfovibrio piezophilus C1TLV30]
MVSVLLAWIWPGVFRLSASPIALALCFLGWGMVFIGIGGYIWSVRAMVRAVKQNRLETSGPFSLVRHPLYAVWILFLFPGVALASGIWIMLGAAVVAWFFFEHWSKEEERFLEEIFGQEYEQYRLSVPALMPFLSGGGPP